jgi:hypothetical protein
VPQCGKYRLLVGLVVVGSSVKLKVRMERCTVYSMTKKTVGSPVNIYVKRGEVAISFSLHRELNALVDTVQVVQEVLKVVGPVWPDDEGVVHVAKPAQGHLGSQIERPLFEVPVVVGAVVVAVVAAVEAAAAVVVVVVVKVFMVVMVVVIVAVMVVLWSWWWSSLWWWL